MGGASLKGQEEALCANKGRWNSNQYNGGESKRNNDKAKSHQGEESSRPGGFKEPLGQQQEV